MNSDQYPNERHGGLEGQVVVVTGAGRGLGRGIAERFGREGSRVVVNTRRAEAAEQVIATICGAGGTAMAALADVSIRSPVAVWLSESSRCFSTTNGA